MPNNILDNDFFQKDPTQLSTASKLMIAHIIWCSLSLAYLFFTQYDSNLIWWGLMGLELVILSYFFGKKSILFAIVAPLYILLALALSFIILWLPYLFLELLTGLSIYELVEMSYFIPILWLYLVYIFLCFASREFQ